MLIWWCSTTFGQGDSSAPVHKTKTTANENFPRQGTKTRTTAGAYTTKGTTRALVLAFKITNNHIVFQIRIY